MIEPALKDDALLADIAAAPRDPGSFDLWWLGQSGFLVHHNNRFLLLDPYLSDSLTRKYANTDKPHIRMTARVIEPRRLRFVDAITSSHGHTDHLDPDTLIPIYRANPAIHLIIPEACRGLAAERLQIPPARFTGMDDGSFTMVGPFEFTAIASAHEQVTTDEQGHTQHLGYVVQFGRFSIYHSGDTLRYEGLAERLAEFSIDVALLPINGREPQRRVAGNLTGREAAQLARDMGAKLAIPCHYDMFTFNTASPEEFVSQCRILDQPCRVLRAGQRFASRELALAGCA